MQLFFISTCCLSVSCQEYSSGQETESNQHDRLKKKRRSHRQEGICRREFLRSLEKRISDVDLVFKGIVEKTYSSNPSKPLTDYSDDDNNLMQDDLQKQRKSRHNKMNVHPMTLYRNQRQHNNNQDMNQESHYRAIVRVKKVYKGSKDLQGSLLIVEGFGQNDNICDSNVSNNDLRIFLVNKAFFGRMRLMSSVLRANQENTRKVIQTTKHRCHHFYSESSKDEPRRGDL